MVEPHRKNPGIGYSYYSGSISGDGYGIGFLYRSMEPCSGYGDGTKGNGLGSGGSSSEQQFYSFLGHIKEDQW